MARLKVARLRATPADQARGRGRIVSALRSGLAAAEAGTVEAYVAIRVNNDGTFALCVEGERHFLEVLGALEELKALMIHDGWPRETMREIRRR